MSNKTEAERSKKEAATRNPQKNTPDIKLSE